MDELWLTRCATQLLDSVREFIAQRALVQIDRREWDNPGNALGCAYGWSHAVAPHQSPDAVSSAAAIHLRESLLREPVNKWAYISLDISLTQPVPPETLKNLCVTICLNDKQLRRAVPHQ